MWHTWDRREKCTRFCEILSSHSGEYEVQDCLLGWRQCAPLKRQSTIILHGSTSQKTSLNFVQGFVGKAWRKETTQKNEA
jgi:hypothetical protein